MVTISCKINLPKMSDQTTDDETLSANTDPVTSWGIVSGFFLLGGLGSTLLIDGGNFVSFILVGCLVASPFWIILTESGAEWYAKEVMDSSPEDLKKSSDTSTSTKSRSNVICQACGWQNSSENNYCHDCGEELGSA